MSKIIRNPDKEYAEKIIVAIKNNNGYCPCKVEKTVDTKCMCLEFRQQESGLCHCGLFVKK